MHRLFVLALGAILLAPALHAEVIIVHTETEFLALVGGDVDREGFEDFPTEQCSQGGASQLTTITTPVLSVSTIPQNGGTSFLCVGTTPGGDPGPTVGVNSLIAGSRTGDSWILDFNVTTEITAVYFEVTNASSDAIISIDGLDPIFITDPGGEPLFLGIVAINGFTHLEVFNTGLGDGWGIDNVILAPSAPQVIERDLEVVLGPISGDFGNGQTLSGVAVFFPGAPIVLGLGDTLVLNLFFDQTLSVFDFAEATDEYFSFGLNIAPGSPAFNGSWISSIEALGSQGDIWPDSITNSWAGGGAGFGWGGQGIQITASQGSITGIKWTTTLTTVNEGSPLTLTAFTGVQMGADGIELIPPPDSDADGFLDKEDNCSLMSNPEQRDTDFDGVGNACDPDFDQNCIVNFTDLNIMGGFFFVAGDFDTDLNGDGLTNFADLSIMSRFFFLPPGPSGLANICDGI